MLQSGDSQEVLERKQQLERKYGAMPGHRLKVHAEDIGLKKKGIGWPTCCPPDGLRDDIVRAIVAKELSAGGKRRADEGSSSEKAAGKRPKV